MPYAPVATQLSPSGSTTTPPFHILTSLLSPPSPLAPDPSIRDRFLSVLPPLSSQYKQCSLVTRTRTPITTTSITLPINKPIKSSLKYPNTGSFGHSKETFAPTRPHVPRDTVPSSSRKSVRFKDTGDGLESIRLFHATGRPSALLDPDSDTESDSDTELDDASSSFQGFTLAGAVATLALGPLKVTQMPLIPSLYIPPNPNIYLESISPIVLTTARPPILRGTVRVRNIAFEKRVAARFTTNDWKTVSEVFARYTGPAIPGGHHHGEEGDDDKWDQFAFSISLEFYAPRRVGGSSHSHAITLLLAVRFTAPGVGEWWDNNGGNNFRIVLAHASAGSKVPGVSDPIPIPEFPRQPQVVTRFANVQANSTMACTRSLLKPCVTPAPTVMTN